MNYIEMVNISRGQLVRDQWMHQEDQNKFQFFVYQNKMG